MCPLVTAFDRVNYFKILPQHFAEVLCLPENIRSCFEKGGFVCNIRGTKMHAVALDEAHEMFETPTNFLCSGKVSKKD